MTRRKRTGIFLPYFQGQRLRDFPQALNGILGKENVTYYDGVYNSPDSTYYLQPLDERILLKVHSRDMVDSVKMTAYYEAACYSAAGSVQAASEIMKGNIDNAFVFTGFGDHHAGKNNFWGMCYFNGAALAISTLREQGVSRVAIVDTDSHHADGTRDIFSTDIDVLHVCFCSQSYHDENNNIDIAIPYNTNDEIYLRAIRQEFVPLARDFNPEVIFWEFGYDSTIGEYGDKGLTRDCHLGIAEIIKTTADDVCHGRLITVLCGGSSRDIATYVIPKLIKHLAGLGN